MRGSGLQGWFDFSTVLTAAQNACTRSLTLGYARSCSRREESLGGSSAFMLLWVSANTALLLGRPSDIQPDSHGCEQSA